MYFETQKLSVGYHRLPHRGHRYRHLAGGILCLIGPNGSGKSTILRSITRHLTKLGGVVAIGGRDLDGMSDKELARHVSVVLTDRIEPELMTCWEVVAAGRYPYTNHFGKLSREDQRIVEDSMARVNALELREQRFTELSDGQKQRVLLARALCQQPEVIVLDEPTSYLDIRHKIELLDILREMTASRGLSVVLSLHEVDLATKLADVVVLVKDNAIFRCGAPEDVLDDDTIRQLYDIHDGSFNLLLGSVELCGAAGEPRVFVVPGEGRGPPASGPCKEGLPLPPGSSSGVTWTGRWRRPWPPAGMRRRAFPSRAGHPARRGGGGLFVRLCGGQRGRHRPLQPGESGAAAGGGRGGGAGAHPAEGAAGEPGGRPAI
ncbi:ABC transporter ATP-binding protein [Flavonifractor plautii]|nr:ABC transporter ATP-binding protein [Flavonifractor plautii]